VVAMATGSPPALDYDGIRFWEGQVVDHEGDLACARTLLAQAEELYEAGARTCETVLNRAADDTIEDDRGLLARARRTFHGVVRRFPQIKTAAKYLGLAAGLLAVAASMFTGVGELATLAFIAGGAATLLDTTLMVSGDGKWTTVAWDVAGLLLFGVGRAYASAARGTAGSKLVEAGRRTATSTREVVVDSVRSGALRDRFLMQYQEWRAFAPETAQGLLPEGRNWVRAFTFWKEIEIPPTEVLRVSREAVGYARASRVIEGIGRVNDVRGVVGSEVELLEGRSQRPDRAPRDQE
jgi:hypothetical protein